MTDPLCTPADVETVNGTSAAWHELMALGERAPAWFAGDNGFTSVAGMRTAHDALISAVASCAVTRDMSIIDLGCGNGALLAALCDRVASLRPVGLERDRARLAHAPQVLPRADAHWYQGDMFGMFDPLAQHRPAIIILMLGRLLEASAESVARLRRRLRDSSGVVLGYAYDDWLARYGGFAKLCAAADVVPLHPLAPSITVAPVAV